MCPVKLLLGFGCQVSLKLRRGLTSWRFVTPAGRIGLEQEALRAGEEEQLVLLDRPAELRRDVDVLRRRRRVGERRVLRRDRRRRRCCCRGSCCVPKKSNRPLNRLPPDLVIVLTTAPVKPPYSAGAPRPWNWYSSTTL